MNGPALMKSPRLALPSPVVNDIPLTDDERVDQAGLGSFPASDPPSWTSGPEQRSQRNSDDPDGGDNCDRARRQRQVDA